MLSPTKIIFMQKRVRDRLVAAKDKGAWNAVQQCLGELQSIMRIAYGAIAQRLPI
jgi:hypothetical protein